MIKGVRAILVVGYIPEKSKKFHDKLYHPKSMCFFSFLKNSSAYNYQLQKIFHLVSSDFIWHMSCLQKGGLKLVNF